MSGTTADLVASVRRRSGMPVAQASFTTAELLAIADEELMGYVVPLVLRQREDYWLRNYDVALSAGVTSYRIPNTAIGNKVRDVQLLDANGNVSGDFPRLSPADLSGADWGFTIQGDRVILAASGVSRWPYSGFTTLRIPYMLRPQRLVDSADATTFGTVSAFNASAKTVTLAADQATWPTTSTPYNVIRGWSPYEVIGLSAPATRSTVTLTFTDALPSDLAVGDIVCRNNTSTVPQLPLELHGLLAQKVACRVLAAKQMNEKLKGAEIELERLERDAVTLISPRVDGEPQRLVVRNGLYRM